MKTQNMVFSRYFVKGACQLKSLTKSFSTATVKEGADQSIKASNLTLSFQTLQLFSIIGNTFFTIVLATSSYYISSEFKSLQIKIDLMEKRFDQKFELHFQIVQKNIENAQQNHEKQLDIIQQKYDKQFEASERKFEKQMETTQNVLNHVLKSNERIEKLEK